MEKMTPKDIVERFRKAKEGRSTWEAHWQECYDFALPQRDGFIYQGTPGEKKTDKLFDGTAPDAVDQLAASLLSQLTPPWSRWFGLTPGADMPPPDRDLLAPELESAANILQSHFDLSNFAVEVHQCYLDLVTAGTASLMFEEAAPGEPTAFRFTALPLSQVVLEEGAYGALDNTFRRSEMTVTQLVARFPKATLPDEAMRLSAKNSEARFPVVEAVVRQEMDYAYMAVLENEASRQGDVTVLKEGRFEMSPIINFRWLKAPGEVYGRSPVMKVLPDIKTANKVVELVLKNASIAVTGVWQADDDGVLNPANIKLTPGAIIPKAVGSAGLTPLVAPGKFDVSQVVLEQLHESIRKALMTDRLGQINGPKMSATEVLERTAEMARVLGATFGRLQSELLTPLIRRALAILSRRGEIGKLRVDGRFIELEYKSPLARYQAQQEARNASLWLETVRSLGPNAIASIDQVATVRWMAKAFSIPAELIRETPSPDLMQGLESAIPALSDLLAGNQQEDPLKAIENSETPQTGKEAANV